MTTRAATATGGGLRDYNGGEGWPGIVSRFQLVLLAGHRSKQLFNGARPRIPADPQRKRNTSIALEELRQGLVTFRAQNGNASQPSPITIDTIGKPTHAINRDLQNAESVNEKVLEFISI
jgi:DNA-directed RNA polymerase omega subunit